MSSDAASGERRDGAELSRITGGRAGDKVGTADAVLLVGFAAANAAQLRAFFAGRADVLTAATAEEGLRRLGEREIAVLCLGEGFAGGSARRFLGDARSRDPGRRRRDVVLAAGGDAALFQDLVDDDRLYYLTPSPPNLSDVESILDSALEQSAGRELPSAPPDDADRALKVRSVLELAARLAAVKKTERAAELIVREASRLVDADAADCRLHDAEDETLGDPGSTAGRIRDSAAAGLVGFVVRTGDAVQLERIGDDPRYDREADNDGGGRDERFLAVAVTRPGRRNAGPRVLAVLAVRRRPSQPPFGDRDRELLELLAAQAAPAFERLALLTELDAGSLGIPAMFRREAAQRHLQGLEGHGHPLQISPQWTDQVFRLLLAIFVVAAAFLLLGSVHEYAAGPAVVRIADRADVTAKLPGTVDHFAVAVGDRVDAGQLLVRFDSAREIAELERIERELELVLVQRLRDPADPVTARNTSTLRAQKLLAEARLEERSVRAPRAGLVSDLRARSGQHLVPGQTLLTLIGDHPELGIVAFLPGRYRPLIRPGMELRLTLAGSGYTAQKLTVDALADEVVGPAEARRFLGSDVGDAMQLNGPVVWVRARLPAATFESQGNFYRYHDGIHGTAEVRVRSERLLGILLPGLKDLLRRTADG